MRKITKTLLITLLTLIMCFNAMSVGASAAEIEPRLSHVMSVDFAFTASEAGGQLEIFTIAYDSFERIDVNVKLQKRFLLVFWNDVDEWNASSTDPDAILAHTFALNGTGMYRATLTVTVTGSDGTVDVITDTIESKY